MIMNWQEMVVTFLGGLGLFLFSIHYMGDGIQQAAGDGLREFIDKYTSNPFYGILVGIAVSGLIQSSSGVMVITVGLVSVGLLTLRQAIGIVMGANIGTTFTAFMIGFKIGDVSLLMIFLGTLLLYFFSNSTLNNFGRIIFGLGGIFFSLKLMSSAMDPLKDVSYFQNYLATLGDKSIQGVAIGAGLTAIIQSSTATVGMIQGLFSKDLLTLQGSIPILLGSNIGTCITVVFASLGTNLVAKRVAAAHVLFNTIGTIVFMILLGPFTSLIELGREFGQLNPEMTVTLAHGGFNVVNTILLFPFIGGLSHLVTKLIPGKEEEVVHYNSIYLNPDLLKEAPSIALGNVQKELFHLGVYTIQVFESANYYIASNDKQFAKRAKQFARVVNKIDEELTHYLVDLSIEDLTESESEVLEALLDSSRDLERISDHSLSLVKLMDYNVKKSIAFSEDAKDDLEQMYRMIHGLLLDAIRAMTDGDRVLAQEVFNQHKKIHQLEKSIRQNHVKRVNLGICAPLAAVNFIDLLTPSARIADHALNLAEKVLVDQF